MTWPHALAAFIHLLRRFGAPADLVARGRLDRFTLTALRAGVKRLETLLRDLIDQAAALLPEIKSRPRRGATCAPSQPGRGGFASADPADWGISFAGLRAPAPKTGIRRRARASAPKPEYLRFSPWPLAERLEAIRRVLADPDRFIRRRARAPRCAIAAPRARHGRDPGSRESYAATLVLAPGSLAPQASGEREGASVFTMSAPLSQQRWTPP